MTSNTQKMKRWLKPFVHTPFHPQWSALRNRRSHGLLIQRYAKGILVDIGCGNGGLRNSLPPSVSYVGIDYPGTMVLGYYGKPDILAKAEKLPFSGSSVDTVVMFDILEHLLEPGQAMSEVSRILHPGGHCIIHVPFLYPLHDEPYDYQRWTYHGIKHLLRKNGFQVQQTIESSNPMGTAAALMTIALAKGILDTIKQKSPMIILVPLILALIPVVNLTGWLLGLLFPSSNLMPSSYYVVATTDTS